MSKKKQQQQKTKMLFLFLGLCVVGLGSLFLAATLLVMVGMIPTLVVFLTNNRGMRVRAITVGALNFGGCYPFLVELANHNHDLNKAIQLILDPLTIVTIFAAAGVGYAVDWAISGIASSVLYQNSIKRQAAIRKQQKQLVEQWGENVAGEHTLDENGFPLSEL